MNELVAQGIPRVCVNEIVVVKKREVQERNEERRERAIVIWIQADKGYVFLVGYGYGYGQKGTQE